MICNVRLNLKNFLVSQGATNSDGIIINRDKFDEINARLTNKLQTVYGFRTMVPVLKPIENNKYLFYETGLDHIQRVLNITEYFKLIGYKETDKSYKDLTDEIMSTLSVDYERKRILFDRELNRFEIKKEDFPNEKENQYIAVAQNLASRINRDTGIRNLAKYSKDPEEDIAYVNIYPENEMNKKDRVAYLKSQKLYDPDLIARDVHKRLFPLEEFALEQLVKNLNTQTFKPTQLVKKGVPELFESNPELANIGTQQQYSQYLDSIFPDSKLKDIVYRADKRTNLTSQTTVDDYTQVYVNGVYYTTELNYVNNYNKVLKGKIYPTILNIVNPAEITTKQDIERLGRNKIEFERINKLKYSTNPKDSLIFDNTKYKTKDKYGEVGKEIVVFEPKQIHILGSKEDIDGFKNFVRGSEPQFQLPTHDSIEEYKVAERTIRDVAARMSHRIGIPVKFESDRTKEYKGKLEKNTAVINLAYATLDTPIHEILAHPIIRAIKSNNIKWEKVKNERGVWLVKPVGDKYDLFISDIKSFDTEQQADDFINNNEFKTLYNSFLKELEYGKGKEVLDRVKKNYIIKKQAIEKNNDYEYEGYIYTQKGSIFSRYNKSTGVFEETTEEKYLEALNYYYDTNKVKYTLEEQQEEALVELLGLYTAGKLDVLENSNLISILKKLLQEIKDFVRDLINQKEIEIDKLPENLTLDDLANILAYSNSKLILPGYEVIYRTPDNKTFKTYAEASLHISELAKNSQDVDLNNFKGYVVSYQQESINYSDPEDVVENVSSHQQIFTNLLDAEKFVQHLKYRNEVTDAQYSKIELQEVDENAIVHHPRYELFIQKNQQYEKSKQIIEEYKKVNNIEYNPEEVYSRSHEFVSVLGAYSDFEVNAMMQNLLYHIEDNEKAGGEFIISAFIKSIHDKNHRLERRGSKIKYKIYPRSKDIKWAANRDVGSGSVWDAPQQINNRKKPELLGVSYTKAPSIGNLEAVKPNLASIIDNMTYSYNELGIALAGNNFRLEYDDDIPHSTKKIIDAINSILDQKYGKLIKPKIEDKLNFEGLRVNYKGDTSFKTIKSYESGIYRHYDISNGEKIITNLKSDQFDFIDRPSIGIIPKVTEETLKESISSIEEKLDERNALLPDKFVTRGKNKGYAADTWFYKQNGEWYMKYVPFDAPFETKVETYDVVKMSDAGLGLDEVWHSYLLTNPPNIESAKEVQKKYVSQAIVNLKVSNLKEIAKKYPRSLIYSEVFEIHSNLFGQYELPFQNITKNEDVYIKDEDGNNMLFYYGTTSLQEEMRNPYDGMLGLGYYLTNNKKDAIFYAQRKARKRGGEPVVKSYYVKSQYLEIVDEPDQITNSGDTVALSTFSEIKVNSLSQLVPSSIDVSNQVNKDLRQLNITNDVIDYLYNQSATKLSKEEYAKEVNNLVSLLRANSSVDEILNNLKCL